MVKQVLASVLVLALSTAGMPPCVGMSMEMGAGIGDMARHHCCDGGTCDDTAGEAMASTGTGPIADCCLLMPAAAAQRPAIQALSPVNGQVTLAPSVLPPGVLSVQRASSHPRFTGPPGSTSVSRHLLLSVLLI